MTRPYRRLALLLAGIALLILLLAPGVVPWPWRDGFSSGQRELSDAERSRLTAAVEASLESPAPARFVWYPLRDKADGIYCALVNTSNVVGDHTEDLLFEAVFAPTADHGVASVTSVYMPGTDPTWRRIIRGNCAKAGYVAAAPAGGAAAN